MAEENKKNIWHNHKTGFVLAIAIIIIFIIGLFPIMVREFVPSTHQETSKTDSIKINQADWYNAGMFKYDKGIYETAKENFNKVLQSDSNYAQAQEMIKKCDSKIQDEKIANTKKKQEETQAEKKFLNSKAGKIYKYCEKRGSLNEVSKEDCIKAANGKIWIGMHIDLVYATRGLPHSVNKSNYGYGNEYQFCWDWNWSPSCFYTKGDYIVYAYN